MIVGALVGIDRTAADPSYLAFAVGFAAAAGLWVWIAVAARLWSRFRRSA